MTNDFPDSDDPNRFGRQSPIGNLNPPGTMGDDPGPASSPDPTGKGPSPGVPGGGLPSLGSGASGTAQSGYAGATASAGASGGTAAAGSSFLGTATSVLPWLQFAYGVIAAQKKGSFVQPPMSPEQKQMFDWAMHQIQSTPTSASMLMPILQHDLGNRSNIDVAALKAGNVGYQPPARMSNDALAQILKTAQPPPPSTGTP